MQDVIKMKKNKLLFYEKGKREELESKLLSQNIKIYPISYLTDKNLNLKYVSISNEEHFVLDITTLVLSALVRNDLRIIYEGWINALSDSDDEVVRRQITIGCNSKLNFRLTSIRPRGLTGNCTFLSD